MFPAQVLGRRTTYKRHRAFPRTVGESEEIESRDYEAGVAERECNSVEELENCEEGESHQ